MATIHRIKPAARPRPVAPSPFNAVRIHDLRHDPIVRGVVPMDAAMLRRIYGQKPPVIIGLDTPRSFCGQALLSAAVMFAVLVWALAIVGLVEVLS